MALKEYDVARQRASQQAQAERQQGQDALKRRFARMGGGLNTGAFVKASQNVETDIGKRTDQRMEGIDAAEASEQRRMQEVQEGRQFSREERLGSQQFASGESALQRRFMTGERLGSQQFAAGESAAQRQFMTSERLSSQQFADLTRRAQEKFARGERLSAQEYGAMEANKQRKFVKSERLGSQKYQSKQFDKGMEFEREKFAEEQFVNRENIRIAEEMMKNPGIFNELAGDYWGGGGWYNPETWGTGDGGFFGGLF